MAWRTDRVALLVAALLLGVGLALGSGSGLALAQDGGTESEVETGGDDPAGSAVGRRVTPPADHGHSVVRPVNLGDDGLTDEVRRRIRNLEVEIMCACPVENWSRTLSNCPDACANAQKQLVRTLVREGRTDTEIFDVMVQQYGGRVLASPDREGFIGRFAYVIPWLIVVFVLIVSVLVVVIWTRSATHATGSAVAPESADVRGFSEAELDRVRAELEELDR